LNRVIWGIGASVVAFAAIAAALLVLVQETPLALAYGNGDGTSSTHTVIGTPVPFSQNYTVQLKGDYVAAGVGMRASGPPGGGSITLPAVPGGSTIKKAFLYWAVVNSTSQAASGMGNINGNAITGTNYGTTASPCWDAPMTRQLYAYVADVTAYATFGSNTLTGFNSGGPPLFPPTEPLLEGASLIVVYENSTSPAHQVDIYQGARSFSGPPVETLTMSGFTAVSGTSQTTWVVADGQPDASLRNKTYVDGVITQADTLGGADGNFWDTNTQNVSANVPPGDTSIQVGTESTNDFGAYDCITWLGQALSTPVSQTTVTVNKAYSPSGDMTPVPVSISCTSGSVTPGSGNAAPGSPFVATVIGFNVGATCTASETTVPPGYIMSSNCGSVAITHNVPASCTITNTETSTTFTVNKVYSPSGPLTPVTVPVTCTSGIVTPPSGSAAPGSPFVTTVHKFNVSGTTCSASETVPSGYTPSSNCTNVPMTNGVPASCTITNNLVVTPNPSAVGGVVEVFRGGAGGSGGGFQTLIAMVVIIAAGVTVGGSTFAYSRRSSR
jgi:hypothetical protein